MFSYNETMCNCGVINQPDASTSDRWEQAGANNALIMFNNQWLVGQTENLPYVQALSAYWHGPEGNAYSLLFCRPLEINEL